MRNWYFILKDMEYEINILDYRILYVYNLKYRKYKNFMYMYVVYICLDVYGVLLNEEYNYLYYINN